LLSSPLSTPATAVASTATVWRQAQSSPLQLLLLLLSVVVAAVVLLLRCLQSLLLNGILTATLAHRLIDYKLPLLQVLSWSLCIYHLLLLLLHGHHAALFRRHRVFNYHDTIVDLGPIELLNGCCGTIFLCVDERGRAQILPNRVVIVLRGKQRAAPLEQLLQICDSHSVSVDVTNLKLALTHGTLDHESLLRGGDDDLLLNFLPHWLLLHHLWLQRWRVLDNWLLLLYHLLLLLLEGNGLILNDGLHHDLLLSRRVHNLDHLCLVIEAPTLSEQLLLQKLLAPLSYDLLGWGDNDYWLSPLLLCLLHDDLWLLLAGGNLLRHLLVDRGSHSAALLLLLNV